MSNAGSIQETRRYEVLEHLVPALLYGADSEPDDARDRATLRQVREDLRSLDGGDWTFSGDVVDTDEFARPARGLRGKVATVTLSRDVAFPAHVWIGYYDEAGAYHCPDTDGRICDTRRAADQYIAEQKGAVVEEAGAEHAASLEEALSRLLETIEALEDGQGGREEWDEVQLAREDARDVVTAYNTAVTGFSWEVGTDGGTPADE